MSKHARNQDDTSNQDESNQATAHVDSASTGTSNVANDSTGSASLADPESAHPEAGPADAGYPDRLDEVSNSLEGLHEALNNHETLETILHRLAETTVQAFPGADIATITIMREGRLRALTTTDSRAAALDQHQTETLAGPHQHAIQQHRPVRVELDAPTQQHWPEFSHTATTAGVAAYLSAPLFTDTTQPSSTTAGDTTTMEPTGNQTSSETSQPNQLLGMLNIYSNKPDAFDPFDEALLRLLTTTASAAITSEHRHARTRELVDQLQQAIASRPAIEQAKGALMAIHSIDADTAFTKLAEQSQQTHTKLHTLVREFLASL